MRGSYWCGIKPGKIDLKCGLFLFFICSKMILKCISICLTGGYQWKTTHHHQFKCWAGSFRRGNCNPTFKHSCKWLLAILHWSSHSVFLCTVILYVVDRFRSSVMVLTDLPKWSKLGHFFKIVDPPWLSFCILFSKLVWQFENFHFISFKNITSFFLVLLRNGINACKVIYPSTIISIYFPCIFRNVLLLANDVYCPIFCQEI